MNIKSIILCALAIIVSQVLGAQDKISEALNKRHLQSTVRYYSPDETSMRYSCKTKRCKRTSLKGLQSLMNRMESSGLLLYPSRLNFLQINISETKLELFGINLPVE